MMLWVTWRQQRLETLIGGVVLALVAVLLLKTGLDLAGTYQRTGVAACVAGRVVQHAPPASCGDVVQAFRDQVAPLNTVFTWLILLPLVVGVLLAAPFVLELEQGTYRLAWTQSITRLRWVAVKLGLIVAAAIVVGSALSMLMTWWHGPVDEVQGRVLPTAFDFEGAVPVAYTVFAVALCVAVGALLRRTVLAVAGALVSFLALRLGVEAWMRPSYLSPLTVTVPVGGATNQPPRLSWVLVMGWKDGLGRVRDAGDLFRACGSADGRLDPACLRRHDFVRYVTYQPADRFWPFQGIESAIFLGLAAGLLALTVWWVRYRIA